MGHDQVVQQLVARVAMKQTYLHGEYVIYVVIDKEGEGGGIEDDTLGVGMEAASRLVKIAMD